MPRLETTTRQLFKFEELSDKAKDKAREWYRDAGQHDEWWEFTYEDAVACAGILGIKIAERRQPWRNITTGKEGVSVSPAIFFSGFWSQGDGACFEGSYAYAKGAAKALREHAPQDEKLHSIADDLAALPYGEGWSAGIKTNGRYSHSGCMSVDVGFDDAAFRVNGATDDLPQAEFTAGEKTITQAMRAFADWIYRQLEKEYERQNADEQVDENILANEYEFEENGTPA